MGHRKSLTRQVQEALTSKLHTGESKHQAKQEAQEAGTRLEGIYSYNTLKAYLKHANYFVKWCKEHHGCRTLKQCRQHVAEYMATRSGLSAYTQKLELSALAKLYGCKTSDFGVTTPRRSRADITRSRGDAVRGAHFSEERNTEILAFARSTGLRREELSRVRGTDLRYDSAGRLCVAVFGGKGGRDRLAPVVGDKQAVKELCERAGGGRVFDHVHSAMDVHACRAEYATALYREHARTLNECRNSLFYNPLKYNGKGQRRGGYESAVYWRRGDLKGTWLDKEAMRIVAEALGHSRISVCGEHYIR